MNPTLASLHRRIAALESQRAADAKVVADAKRHVFSLCRQARRILADNKRLRMEAKAPHLDLYNPAPMEVWPVATIPGAAGSNPPVEANAFMAKALKEPR